MGETLQILYAADGQQRLDKYLADAKIPELYSRTIIDRLISEANVTVNNTQVKKSFLLKSGDSISVLLPEPITTDIIAQDIALDIVWEDEFVAVINKPAGLIVHPGFGNPDQTLVNAIVYRWGKNLSQDNGSRRPGIVHRLDRGTSGLLLVAKNDAIQSALSQQFAERKVKKTYLAITTGIPAKSEDRIAASVSRNPLKPCKMSVNTDGKIAITSYRVVHYYHFFSLLEVDLETGRTHQIRVHLEHQNTPILGDVLYNKMQHVQAAVPDNMKRKVADLLTHHLHRQALHAWKISFTHPVSHIPLAFEAPLPTDLIYTLDWLEQHFAIDKVSYREKLLISAKQR
jgi:23S rRNA pseudouridine1911/1915/1917 synthase